MQTSVFYKINVSTRLLILMLLILSIFIAKSIYLISLLSIISVILVILTNKSVKFYVDLIKNVKFWLSFVFIAYIIVFRNILDSFVLIYKLLLVIIILKSFSFTVNFNSLASGIKTLLNPLKSKINVDNISYNITIFIYFFKEYINSKKIIFENYTGYPKIVYNFSFKYNILPRIFFSVSKIDYLESNLKLKFYRPKYEEKNKKSNIALFVFFVLFILVVFKEVIL